MITAHHVLARPHSFKQHVYLHLSNLSISGIAEWQQHQLFQESPLEDSSQSSPTPETTEVISGEGEFQATEFGGGAACQEGS